MNTSGKFFSSVLGRGRQDSTSCDARTNMIKREIESRSALRTGSNVTQPRYF